MFPNTLQKRSASKAAMKGSFQDLAHQSPSTPQIAPSSRTMAFAPLWKQNCRDLGRLQLRSLCLCQQLLYPAVETRDYEVPLGQRFIEPILKTHSPDDIPLSERFFIGGLNCVRGYRDFDLGPHFKGRSEIRQAVFPLLFSPSNSCKRSSPSWTALSSPTRVVFL